MKKISTFVLVLALTFSLTACGSSPGISGGDNTPGGSTAPSPASQAVSESPSGNNGEEAVGGFKNLVGDPLTIPETAPTIEEAVGVSVEGERIVKQYTEKLFSDVYKPDGCTVIYSVYEFDPATGKVADSSLWYGGFTDEALFSAAFQEKLDATYEEHIRGYNMGGGYFGYYTWPAIQTNEEDGVATWEDAVAGGEYENDINYILIV